MPVENAGTFFPVANVQFESSDKPEVVEADAGQKSTKFHVVEIGDVTEDHTEIHSQESTNAFPNPEPYSVTLEGFGPDPKAQTKVVKSPPKKAAPKATGGAEGK